MTFHYARRLRPWATCACALALGGCIVDADLGNSDTEGTTSSPTSGTSDVPPIDGGETSHGSSGELPHDSSTDGDTTTDGPPEFACPPMPFEAQCDFYAQDCPDGFHCIPWATGAGGGSDSFDATVCAPLAAEPAGHNQPCQIDDEGCSDDCPTGDYCLPTTEFGGGLCVGICDPNFDAATCAEGDTCTTCAKCALGTCYPSCDPIAPDCPAEAPTCDLDPPGDGFMCLPIPAGEQPLGASCDGLDRCEPGLLCAGSEFLDACAGLIGCCTELCDLNDGDPGCANPAHACITLFWPGPAPAGQEHVGYCGLPENDPCLVPGQCAPEGVDQTSPWCSLSNEGGCATSALAGFFNGVDCEQSCVCEMPCMGPADCPTPPTGTATGDCVAEPFGPGSPTTCMYSCAAGETCPDGMTCSAELGGPPICLWLSPAPPDECL